MPATPTTFDAGIPRWTQEQQMPWSRLKYTIVNANLRRHLLPGPLRILDAGGGNGFDSMLLAREGHIIDIVDYSTAMLDDAVRRMAAANVSERVSVHTANLMEMQHLFPASSFDVVLCHNVLQYVDDVPALLAAVSAPLKPDGLLSLISVNRYSNPYQAAFLHGDLTEARARLDQRVAPTTIFGATMNLYSADEIIDMLGEAAFTGVQHYGIRCVTDYWGDNVRKSDPDILDQLEQLELALTDRYPYKLLARYFQIVASKQ